MSVVCFVLLICFYITSLIHCENVVTNKLCIDQENRDACQQIERDNVIACQGVSSKVDCILSAGAGNPVLTVLEPEEALLGAALTTDQAVVIAEFAQETYATVVLIRNGQNGLDDRELRYCHPGYAHSELITKYVTEELDRKIIKYSCASNTTLLEQKFEALSGHLQSSCRPGKWSEDDSIDAQLKATYSNLCDLCGDQGCNVVYQEPFKDTLTCLAERNGSLALTTAKYASEFLSNTTNSQLFQYLCPDGTISSRQCVWTNQTKRVFVTSRASAVQMTDYIKKELSTYVQGIPPSDNRVELSLTRLLNIQSNVNLINPVSLSQYVSGFREIPSISANIQCSRTVLWSVTNDDEWLKCQWLRQAAVNVGLQPVISCAKSADNDTVSNMDNIKNGVGDIAFVEADYGYRARKRNLTKIAYLETDRRQLSRIALIVRDNTSWFNGNFANLKDKRLCLPEYGGKEWLTLLDVLIRNGAIESTCDYGEALSSFVGDSCAPGANEAETEIPNTNVDRFCANCVPLLANRTAKYCNGNYQNKYYGSVGALDCLTAGDGDYAVVTVNDIPRDRTIPPIIRGVAKNGTYIDFFDFYSNDVNPLIIITAGEVLIRQDNPKFNDIVQLLRSIEKDFGQNLNKAFKVFERFNHIKDLLFPDSTPGITISGGNNVYIANYQELLSNSESCFKRTEAASSSIMTLSNLTFLLLCILLVRKI
ncbi:hypothetical protein GWI33_007860 [Rhynchophorus ferrugineus]|uniref:Transferrin-like domain-containing protein n=1 Tax=Rhynchophorus ferrugineus TaxID=354439 RepID=A0A834IFJ5_RHYFE|nr:hypothetical protein GWI33_007860 [Rhynchophorus ferrugineus]